MKSSRQTEGGGGCHALHGGAGGVSKPLTHCEGVWVCAATKKQRANRGQTGGVTLCVRVRPMHHATIIRNPHLKKRKRRKPAATTTHHAQDFRERGGGGVCVCVCEREREREREREGERSIPVEHKAFHPQRSAPAARHTLRDDCKAGDRCSVKNASVFVLLYQ
jgi:hypothetical protein